MKDMLSFINRQAAAIKRVDPHALVTVGARSELSMMNQLRNTNFYSDECLIRAGGNPNGTLSFYVVGGQADRYGRYGPNAPINTKAWMYRLNKPLFINDLSQQPPASPPIEIQMLNAYYGGYAGAWTWISTQSTHDPADFALQTRAVQVIRDYNLQGDTSGGRVNVKDILYKHQSKFDHFLHIVIYVAAYVVVPCVVIIAIIVTVIKRRRRRARSMFVVIPSYTEYGSSDWLSDDGHYEYVVDSKVSASAPLLSPPHHSHIDTAPTGPLVRPAAPHPGTGQKQLLSTDYLNL
jgi:hypothetical protein